MLMLYRQYETISTNNESLIIIQTATQ